MTTRSTIALGVSRHQLCAVAGAERQGHLVIENALIRTLPGSLARQDPEAVGRWVGEELADAGFPRAGAVVAMSREQIGLKRMTLPSIDPVELPGMTRFAMQRELPFDASEAVIDFLPTETRDGSTTVVAVAAPAEVIDFTRRMVKAAGLRLERISLRVMGVAALVGTSGAGRERAGGGPELVIDVTGDGFEFCIVENGAVRFSRAADYVDGDEPAAMAEAVVTETRRTWMSFRIVQETEGVSGALVMGHGEVVARCTGPIADMLKVPAAGFDAHPLVDCAGEGLGPCWPLAGLLLRQLRALPSIDLAAPHRAPDVGARRRQLVLVAVGLAIVGGAALAMSGFVKLDRLRERARSLSEHAGNGMAVHYQTKRQRARLEHLRQWENVGADWLWHIEQVVGLEPAPGEVVLEQWSGTLDFRGVRCEDNVWSAPASLRLIVQGRARERSIADAFRERLVNSRVYDAETTGPDSAGAVGAGACPFAYTLRTRLTQPGPPPAAAGEGGS